VSVLGSAQLGLIKDQKFERLSREIIELRKADPESEPPVAFIAAPEREREETPYKLLEKTLLTSAEKPA